MSTFFSKLSSHVPSININQINLIRAFPCFNIIGERPVRSVTPRNSSMISSVPEQGASEPTMAADSNMIPMEISTQPAADRDSSDDHQAGDNLRRTKKAVLSIALFIGATSGGLIINVAEPLRSFFLITPYNTLLNLSVFISASLAIYYTISINSTGRNHTSSSLIISDDELALLLIVMMGFGLLSIFLALVLRGLMVQNYTSLLLALLLFFITIIGLIFLSLWMVWKKKRNNIQTAVSPTSEGQNIA